MTIGRCRIATLVALVSMILWLLPVAARAAVGTPLPVPTPSPEVRIAGSGWGHGVGMSQYGAQAQALSGWSVNRILRHWYRGIGIGRSGSSDEPITVNLSTAARRPGVVVQSGSARWLRCAPTCRPLRVDGDALVQSPSDGTWTVAATSTGQLSIRRGGEVLWQGEGVAPATPAGGDRQGEASKLRLQLSSGDRQRRVARVLGHRYRWGALEFGVWGDASCRGPQLCVNVRVPTVERYLRGLSEMPSSWANAALGAQATVGRTYALRMLERGIRPACRCHLLATTADQVYEGLDKEEGFSGDRWVAQVDATAGRVVRYRGALAATFYSSSHGGRSERISDSYAYSAPASAYPYLRSVNDPWSADPRVRNPYARWTATVGNRAFARYVDDRMTRVTGIAIRSRTAGGTPRRLLVSGIDRAGAPLVVDFAGAIGKQVGDRRVWIAGAEMKQRFSLRSQQIRSIGLAPFSDDDGNTHEYAIASLAAAGVTTGCRADRYCPGEAVTRAQTAALLARALQLAGTATDAFADDDGSVHEPDINAVARAGVAKGCTPADFCPGRTLRRGQMASLLARALQLPRTPVDAFADDDSSVHEDNINRLAAAGVTDGTASGDFSPDGTVTRAQLATFLVRALRRAG